MNMRLILLSATALLISSCDTAKEGSDGTASGAAAATASAADEDAIRALDAGWVELVKAKDAAAITQLYTEDGAFMPSHMPMGMGHAAIEQTWTAILGTPGFDLNFGPEEITLSASGDMALERGTYQLNVAPAGEAISDTGKYVVVWRKVDGEWKAAADIFNSDLPAAGG